MSQEIEIRLSARPGDLRRLSQTRFVKRLSQGNAATRRYNTVYYDTPEFALAGKGLCLRVRRSGRIYVQTVKEKNTGAVASDRVEWESPLPTPEPDLRFVPDPKTRERLMALTGDKKIEAKLETVIRRTTRHLKTEAGDEVEFAADSGEIRTLVDVREVLPVSEIELELKRGSPNALYQIARGLSEKTRLTVAIESKAERGLRALEGQKNAAFKAGRLALPLGATAEDAFRITLLHCLRHIAQNTPAVSEARDVEGLHQLRVGLRRLRAALEIFGKAFETEALKELRSQAKLLGNAYGKTRDLDVFAIELFPPVEAATPGRAGIAALRKHLETTRAESWARCVAQANSREFTRFLLDLAAAAETRVWREGAGPAQIAAFIRPAEELAREALGKRERNARKRARHLADLNTERRHRLRIALKKLRYTVEFFAPLFDAKDVNKYLKKLGAAQDVFGAMNDAATASHILGLVLENASPEQSTALREGAALVDGWHLARIAPAWRDAKSHWKNLEKSNPFWAV
jgi:inorganic triphosphatase YgiF